MDLQTRIMQNLGGGGDATQVPGTGGVPAPAPAAPGGGGYGGGTGGGSTSAPPAGWPQPQQLPTPAPAPQPTYQPAPAAPQWQPTYQPAPQPQPGYAPPAPPAPPAPAPAPQQQPPPGYGQPAPTPAQQQQMMSVVDALRHYGYDSVPQGANDHQALQHLILQARQNEQARQEMGRLRELAGYGQQYLTQQQQQQLAQQQQQGWFKAPEFNPEWRRFLYRDATDGSIKATPDAPAGIIEKYRVAQEHERRFLDSFVFNPIEAIKPGLQELVRQEATQLMQQTLQQRTDYDYSRQFIAENSTWLHERTQDGQVLTDPASGAPRLSPWGQRFKSYVGALQQQGVQGDQALAVMAKRLVDADYLAMQQQQQQQQQAQQQQGVQQQQQFLQRAQQTMQPLQPYGGHQPPQQPAQPAAYPAMPLAERLRQAFRANGVTDDQILQSMTPGFRAA